VGRITVRGEKYPCTKGKLFRLGGEKEKGKNTLRKEYCSGNPREYRKGGSKTAAHVFRGRLFPVLRREKKGDN